MNEVAAAAAAAAAAVAAAAASYNDYLKWRGISVQPDESLKYVYTLQIRHSRENISPACC